MKTKKTIAKRFKVTKRGVIAKKAGHDHFNAKESSKITKNKRRSYQFSKSFTKTILKHI